MNPIKFSVPKPCNENWDAMTPESQGRFCSLCEKSVVDFTGMKQPEITGYLLANQSNKVCGRFTTNQLQQNAQPIIPPALLSKIVRKPLNFRQMFIVALMACMGSTLFSCNNITGEPAIDASAKDSISQQQMPPQRTLGMVAYPDSLSEVKFIPLTAAAPKAKQKEHKTKPAVAEDKINLPALTGLVAIDTVYTLPATQQQNASASDTIAKPKQ